MASAHETQFDQLLTGRNYGILPKHLPGRVTMEDYIIFKAPATMNVSAYDVVVTSNDTAGPLYRKIGPLSLTSFNLPFVHFDAYSEVYVIPKTDARLPRFFARLNRGSTYTIPQVTSFQPGQLIQMNRSGMLTAAV